MTLLRIAICSFTDGMGEDQEWALLRGGLGPASGLDVFGILTLQDVGTRTMNEAPPCPLMTNSPPS